MPSLLTGYHYHPHQLFLQHRQFLLERIRLNLRIQSLDRYPARWPDQSTEITLAR